MPRFKNTPKLPEADLIAGPNPNNSFGVKKKPNTQLGDKIRHKVGFDESRKGQDHFDPVVRAAWLYFRDGLAQQEIAESLGISRSSVSNLLMEAKRRQVYKIEFSPAVIRTHDAAQKLQDRYGLETVYIVPGDGDAARVRARIGNAGALLLGQKYAHLPRLGVCWGRTVLALADALDYRESAVEQVYQMVGSARSRFWDMVEACDTRIAAALGAKIFQFPAPGRVSSPQLFKLLVEEEIVAAHLHALDRLDGAVFGLCSLSYDSLIFSSGLVYDHEVAMMQASAAVGIIGGRHYDRSGAAVHFDGYDATLLALEMERLKSIPHRLAVAGGADKVPALLGALRGGLMTDLVTDSVTAQALLSP